MIFIYALCDPVSKSIRYIGKANNPAARLVTHISRAKTGRLDHHNARWIRKLLSRGALPELKILAEVKDGERWQDVERRFIAGAMSAGLDLTNTRAGGEGADYIDPIARARRIASLKAAYQRPEVKATHAAAMATVNARAEVRAQRSATSKLLWESPEYRAKIHSESTRAKMSCKQKARLTDPAERERLLQLARDPARNAENSKLMAARNADPAFRAKVSGPEVRARAAATLTATWARRKAAKHLEAAHA